MVKDQQFKANLHITVVNSVTKKSIKKYIVNTGFLLLFYIQT